MFSRLDLPLQTAQAQRRAAAAATTRLGEHARARELLHAATPPPASSARATCATVAPRRFVSSETRHAATRTRGA